MDSIQIPDKVYFKIGEVAKLLDVEPYVLRYWETEFDQIKPQKTKSGQRCYQRREIETLVAIKELLYHEMFTIAGARRQLKTNRQVQLPLGEANPADDASLREELEVARRANAELEERLTTAEVEREGLFTKNEELASQYQELVTREPVGSVDTHLVNDLELENQRLLDESVSLRAALLARTQRRRRAISAARLELESLQALVS